MNGLAHADRALIARAVAALVRNGWSATRATSAVAASLPPGRAQERIHDIAAALGRGETAPASQDDPLVALLARGESISPAALEDAARAEELAIETRRLLAGAVAAPLTGVLVGGVILIMGTFVIPAFATMFNDFGAQLPWPTVLMMHISQYLPFAGSAMILGSIALSAIGLTMPRLLPGVRQMRAAAMLRQVTAALTAGIRDTDAFARAGIATAAATPFTAPSLALNVWERRFGAHLAGTGGLEPAVRALSTELEIEARQALRVALFWIPFLGFLVLGITVGLFVIAAYLPIFTITNTLQ